MNLSLDVQLQVALRALNEVVAPALGDAEKHVVEQLHLAIATISFVKLRLPDARRFARMELADYLRLAKGITALPASDDTLSALIAKGDALLESATADTADIEVVTRILRERVTLLASECTDAAVRREIDRMVLEQGGALLNQNRQWASFYGFEIKPEELPAPAW